MPRETADKENSPVTTSQRSSMSHQRAGTKVRSRHEADEDGGEDVVMDEKPVDDDEAEADSSEAESSEGDIMTYKKDAKREVRAYYRDLGERQEEAKKDLASVTVDSITNLIKASDVGFEKVKGPAEAVLDSNIILQSTEQALAKLRSQKIGADDFDTDEFLLRLASFMGGRIGNGKRLSKFFADDDSEDEDGNATTSRGRDLDWTRLGSALLLKRSKRIPTGEFMYGPLGIELKKKREKTQRRTQKADESQRVRAQEVKADDVRDDQNDTGRLVQDVHVLLAKVQKGYAGGRVPYLEFVVNPDSFGQTVENMFYFAFLVKEGDVALEWQGSGKAAELVCYAVAKEEKEDGGNDLGDAQAVFELTYELWQDAKEAYNITKPMISTRQNAHAKLGANEW